MDNKPSTQPAPNRKDKGQLNVRLPDELLRRVSAVAGAIGKTVTDFVSETLDERTKEHKPDIEKIAERERLLKRWKR
jgi:predicted HicB family RNase H-like nuclease